MMYGDAGAAILLERSPEAELTSILRTDGSHYKTIISPAGGFRDMYPSHDDFMCKDGNRRSLYDIYMEGTTVFSFSISDVPQAIEDFMKETSTTAGDYDLFAFHQANQFILKQLSRKLKLTADKVPISLDRFGNTGAISIPLTLCSRFAEKPEGTKKILMAGFGIGFSWGIASTTVDTGVLCPIVRTSDWFEEGKITPEML